MGGMIVVNYALLNAQLALNSSFVVTITMLLASIYLQTQQSLYSYHCAVNQRLNTSVLSGVYFEILLTGYRNSKLIARVVESIHRLRNFTLFIC
jgi:hypothetical protein